MTTHPMHLGTDRFQAACWFALEHETEFVHGRQGDYSKEDYVRTEHDPNDPGGTTRYGIDAASQPGVDIDNLTFDGAVGIYWNKYWRINGIAMDELPTGWGEILFDIHINGGDPVRLAQRACIMSGIQVIVDGALGPRTIAAMTQAGHHGLVLLLHLREVRYEALVDEHPRFSEYLNGWTDRNNDLAQFVGVELPELQAV